MQSFGKLLEGQDQEKILRDEAIAEEKEEKAKQKEEESQNYEAIKDFEDDTPFYQGVFFQSQPQHRDLYIKQHEKNERHANTLLEFQSVRNKSRKIY